MNTHKMNTHKSSPHKQFYIHSTTKILCSLQLVTRQNNMPNDYEIRRKQQNNIINTTVIKAKKLDKKSFN